MKVLAFGTSNSRHSINQSLAQYAAGLLPGAEVETLDINDYEMPIFSIEREQTLGQPDQARAFLQRISKVDALIVSFAEHNGNLTAAYKNLFDWSSRIDTKVYQGKPVVFLATSPGKGGAATALKIAVDSAPYFGADLRGSFSVPDFTNNFNSDRQDMTNTKMHAALLKVVGSLDNTMAQVDAASAV